MRNESGFSLAEIVVASGLLGVIALGVTKYSEQMNRVTKSGEVRYDKLQIQKEIAQILANPDSCLKTFSGINAKKGVVNDIKDSAGSIKFEKGRMSGIQSMKIKELRLDDSSPEVSISSPGKGDTYLVVTYEEKKGIYGGYKPSKIKLSVDTDASGKILGCLALASGSGGLWSRSSSDFDSIYYNGNGVGINKENPVATLDVNGVIKVGDGGMVCDTNMEGGLKYVSNKKSLFLCSDSIWRRVLLEDPFVWVAASNPSDIQKATCKAKGFSVATDQGYGICASGEDRPLSGDKFDSILYSHGKWGTGDSRGGTIHNGTFCYAAGQKQDGDGTDILVAWLCKRD